jgi:hypothetical protein
VALVQVGAQLLASLLDHLINLVEPLLAKVTERLADDLVDMGVLRAGALAMTAAQSTGAVRELAEAHAMMERLRTLYAFAQYQKSETDAVN